MKEVLPDNPASRLLNILNKALEIDFNPDVKSGAIWAKVLNVGSKPSELLPAYSQLFILTEDAYEAVTKFYPKQRSTHTKWKQGISNCLQSNSPYHHPWKNVADQLKSSEIIDTLQVAEDNLAHYVMRTSVDELSIERLKEEFEELRAKISEEESFSGHLKNFLIGELEKILNALENYDLNGSSPIRESIYNIVSNTDLENNSKFSFGKQLCGFLVVAATSISIVNDIADLPDSLVFLKEKLFLSSKSIVSPNDPTRPVLPKELAEFRKEEVEPSSE